MPNLPSGNPFLVRAYFDLPCISSDTIVEASTTVASDAIIKNCRPEFISKHCDEFAIAPCRALASRPLSMGGYSPIAPLKQRQPTHERLNRAAA